jgi:hypothetical protein
VRVITINDRQVGNVGITTSVYNRFLTTVTLSYEITLPFSPKHLLEGPRTFQSEYNNKSSDIQMPKVLPNLYDRFTNCSYNSLAPSTRQLPIAAATTTWSTTTTGMKISVIHYDIKQLR